VNSSSYYIILLFFCQFSKVYRITANSNC
jgi:hypothetical protein